MSEKPTGGETPDPPEAEETQAPPRKRSRVRRFVGLVAPTFIVLLGLEVALRIGSWAWHGGNEYYLFYGIQGLAGRLGVSPWSVYDGSHFKFPPNYTLQSAAGQGEETARTNSLGFRGADFEPAKDPDVFRVITLGGSSTFGFHNEDDETYPYFLQERFEAEAGGGGVEVINAGFPYYTTASIRSLLEDEVIEYEPDLVTLYTAYNDASWPLRLSPFLKGLFWIQQHSSTWLIIKETVFPDIRVYQMQNRLRRQAPGEGANLGRIEADADSIAARYRRNIEAIADLVEERGAELVVIRQPMTTVSVNRGIDSLSFAEEYRAVQAKLAGGAPPHPFELRMIYQWRLLEELDELAANRGLRVVDNVALTDADRTQLTSHVHLSGMANEWLAEALHGVIAPIASGAPDEGAGEMPVADEVSAGEGN